LTSIDIKVNFIPIDPDTADGQPRPAPLPHDKMVIRIRPSFRSEAPA